MDLVSEIMSANPVCCTPVTRIEEIERLMKEQNTEEIPIVDTLYEKNFLGIITEKEITKRADEDGVKHSELNTEQCMTLNPITVYAESSIDECFRLMDSNHLTQIPVIDGGGHICGIVERSAKEIKPEAKAKIKN
ncbi:MAG: CBS domain-containing protein [Bacteriovorax sp.]|nr:CBS domain-containing protein [Bacteriovorax sp.]